MTEPDTGFPTALDSTIVSTYSSCPRKAELSYLEHWSPPHESVHLHAGAAYAAGLETMRRTYWTGGQNWEQARTAGENRIRTEWGDYEPPAGAVKTLDNVIGAFHHYCNERPPGSDPFQPYWHGSPPELAVEMSFAIPLPIEHPTTGDPILYAGRFDQVVEYGGQVLCLDDKTTSQLGAKWADQWQTRGQFMGYTWAMQQSGIDVRGAVVRGMMFGHTQRSGPYWKMADAVVWHTNHVIERWYGALLAKVRRMVEDFEAGVFDVAYNDACSAYGGCQFREICLSHDPNHWLEANFTRRQWSPLNPT